MWDVTPWQSRDPAWCDDRGNLHRSLLLIGIGAQGVHTGLVTTDGDIITLPQQPLLLHRCQGPGPVPGIFPLNLHTAALIDIVYWLKYWLQLETNKNTCFQYYIKTNERSLIIDLSHTLLDPLVLDAKPKVLALVLGAPEFSLTRVLRPTWGGGLAGPTHSLQHMQQPQ